MIHDRTEMGEIIANVDEICSLNEGWIGFIFIEKEGKLAFFQFSEWV